ncbi:MAG: MFS transporter [Chloroflexi bacterium]|nr:MFS transporter [Chloroflexota bacterium]
MRESRFDWFWVSMAGGLYWVNQALIRPMVALYAVSLGLPPGLVGLILAMQSVLPLILAIPGGAVSDAFGRKRLLVGGAMLMIVGGLLYVASGNVWLLILAQTVAGTAGMVVWLVSQTLITEVGSERSRVRNIGNFGFFIAVGQLVGPVLGGYLADVHSFTAVFWAYTTVSVALFFTTLVCPSGMASRGGFDLLASYRTSIRLLARPGLQGVILCTFLALFTVDSRSAFFPIYMGSVGYSMTVIGLFIAVGNLVSAVARPFLEVLIRLFGERLLAVGSILVAVFGVGATPFFSDPFPLLIITIAISSGMGINQPLTIAMLASQTSSQERSLGMSLRLTANRLASLTDPMAFGLLAQLISLRASFIGVAAMLLPITLLAAARLYRPAQPRVREMAK